MRQNWFLYDGQLLRDLSKEIDKELTINRKNAAHVIRNEIRKKALAIRKSGNLARGVYEKHDESVSFVGIHAPGFQNFLLEFGHFQGKKPIGDPGRLEDVQLSDSLGNLRFSKRGNPITRKRRIGFRFGPDDRKFVPAHPIVYPTFEETASECIAIMSQEILTK